ncbi:MAG: tetratricopeptide repeat protein [Chloroflexi bacterium]|nr:tetratricopeptide repeat protein [Chloroflexota bacterium]
MAAIVCMLPAPRGSTSSSGTDNVTYGDIVAQEGNKLELAEDWYRRALAIRERLGFERDAATDYHQLGIVAHKRNQLELADEWYRKALESSERLGYPSLKVYTLAQFALLCRQRGNLEAMLIAFVAAWRTAVDYRMPIAQRIVGDLRQFRTQLGAVAFADLWRSVINNQEDLLGAIEKSDSGPR